MNFNKKVALSGSRLTVKKKNLLYKFDFKFLSENVNLYFS